jgi:glycine/D-amino acid oxidase-like deaminating enzyme
MISLPHDTKSYWMESAETPGYPRLKGEVTIDVTIIGAGVAGLTTAYLLKKSGLSVAVIEKDTVGAGVSGHTTGKVTSQHNLIYERLSKRLGKDTARIYGQANQSALLQIADIIREEGIDCGWHTEDSYVYTTDSSQIERFKAEAAAAQECVLPATFETSSPLPLPFPIKGAVRFSGQASFHVRKYLLGLAKAIDGNGSYVYEHSHAIGIREGQPCRVTTPAGRIMSNDIVVATNVPTFPLLARGAYCIAEYPKQSYIVAGRLKEKDSFEGMYISPDKDNYSILPIHHGAQRLLLIGGEGHIPGTRLDTGKRYQRLADYAEKNFGITAIEYQWSHRDYLGYDDMPLIGRLYPWSKHTYTATAFMKWGLTNGTVAGMLLNDMVQGRHNQWSDTFNPHRLKTIASIPKVIGENLGIT